MIYWLMNYRSSCPLSAAQIWCILDRKMGLTSYQIKNWKLLAQCRKCRNLHSYLPLTMQRFTF